MLLSAVYSIVLLDEQMSYVRSEMIVAQKSLQNEETIVADVQ